MRQLWRDRERGDVWVVEVEDSHVVACAGPLDPGELSEELLDTLQCEEAEAAWLQRHRDRFVLWEAKASEIWPT